ncbi:50S ribosomal protein L13 [bacterium]|nr:50S ribosomal protein L13 [bacterium]|tara:strand:+ start:11775 stop:12122 length:348 start_codon:yes stop_codon:yes gene_type:complete
MATFTIDAQDRQLGRVASEAALLLRGKTTPDFKANVAPKVKVHVVNASKLNITERKAKGKVYTRYTGYPGGLREQTLEELIAKKGHGEAVRKAVYGMLPGNKLRKEMLKNLTITD